MPVTMICPNLNCGRTVIASDGARGKVVRCAHCQQLFLVPARENKREPGRGDDASPEEKEREKERR